MPLFHSCRLKQNHYYTSYKINTFSGKSKESILKIQGGVNEMWYALTCKMSTYEKYEK